MNAQPGLTALEQRLCQVENALADAQARVPGLRAEVRAIGQALGELARGAPTEVGDFPGENSPKSGEFSPPEIHHEAAGKPTDYPAPDSGSCGVSS